ncbi:MAG TPA: hypothetical protein VMU36_00915, partial [Spirochaetia bacterium]|nr:hypothetical protein [Spirochaetia bacterium]
MARPLRDTSCPDNEQSKLRQIVDDVGSSLRTFLDTLRRLCASRAALISMVILLFWLLMSIIGPLVTPYNPTRQNIVDRFKGPSLQHLCGTDRFGRDVFSRIVMGSRTVFLLSASSTLASLVIGTFVGLASGYAGGA